MNQSARLSIQTIEEALKNDSLDYFSPDFLTSIRYQTEALPCPLYDLLTELEEHNLLTLQ